jgi:hypothetical protein
LLTQKFERIAEIKAEYEFKLKRAKVEGDDLSEIIEEKEATI